MSRSPTYNNWMAMKSRCNNEDNQDYDLYGGRGIRVCKRWDESFEAFLADMGERPAPKMSIDRIDVDGNYEPGNCRWATQQEQTRNKSNNLMLTHNGESLPLAEWAERTGLQSKVIRDRLNRGWPVDLALTLGRQHRWSCRGASGCTVRPLKVASQ